MTMPVSRKHPSPARPGTGRAILLSSILAFAACSDSDDPPAAIPTTPDPVVGVNDPLPGVVVDITDVGGGSGADGNFRVGDFITITLTLRRNDGVPLELSGLTRGAVMVSGPTYNYQRVIGSAADVLTAATKTAVDTYRYTFASPIPAAYLPPLNDTPGLTVGELTGQPLLSGTYTVGIELRKDYTIDGTVYRDVGNAAEDFRFGDATAVEPREVVTLANCNQCHTRLSAHGGNRTEIVNCLLCHTSGSEDRNTSTVAGGTPGVTIDFKVMIHKIHAGAYLPSVLGVSTRPTGLRDYSVTPQPYQMIGFNDTLIDFSDIVFPVWPSFYTPMPRDSGYSSLTSNEQSRENLMRRAPVDCASCHGDPDGGGPLPAPAQSDLIYAQPSRLACGSCHDDWVWDRPYFANGTGMPLQTNDAHCKECHTATDLRANHRHPLVDPTVATGLNIDITSVTDVGGDNDGHFDAGERIQFVFEVTDDNGGPVDASAFTRLEYTLSGPNANPQFLTYGRLALSAGSLSGPGPYTVNVPEIVYLDPIGASTTTTLQTFVTSRAPHWHVTTGTDPKPTTLQLRTATGASTSMTAPGAIAQNYIDVAATGGISNGSHIVIDGAVAGSREFLRVQQVDGNRLWFGTVYTTSVSYKPGLTRAHASGASVQVVTLTAIPASSWTLDPATGVITETTEFGNGEVLADYWTDYLVPSVYPGSINNTLDQRADYGDWQGLALLDGTYTLDLHGRNSFTVDPTGTEPTSYTQGAPASLARLLFGNASTVELPARVEGAALCNKCHVDIQFHGGSRRGYDSCMGCHGTAAVEDQPPYAGGSTATPTFTAEFRVILHELHAGVFPSMPGGVAQCAVCHGDGNDAWKTPAPRLHPNQAPPTRAWGVACGSCHTSTGAQGHIASMTSPTGFESCANCHGEGAVKPTEYMHLAR